MNEHEQAEKLRNELLKLPAKERLSEILRLWTIDATINDTLSGEQLQVLESLFQETLLPEKNGRPDLPRFFESLSTYSDLMVQAQLHCGKEIAAWKSLLDNRKEDKIEIRDGKAYSHNLELAKEHACHTSPGSFAIATKGRYVTPIGLNGQFSLPLMNNWNELLEQRPDLKSKYLESCGADIETAQKMSSTEEELSSLVYIYILNFMNNLLLSTRKEEEQILCREGNNAGLHQNLAAEKLGEEKVALKESAVGYQNASRQLLKDWPDVWIQAAKAMTERNELMTYWTENPDSIQTAAKDAVTLFEKMERDYRSLLYDTQSYKNMKAPLEDLRRKMEALGIGRDANETAVLTEAQTEELQNLLKTVAGNAAAYVAGHAEKRKSEVGIGRFQTAMSIISAIDHDLAKMAAEGVNEIRSTSTATDKQLVRLDVLEQWSGVHKGFDSSAYFEQYEQVENAKSSEAEENLITTHEEVEKKQRETDFANAKNSVYDKETWREKIAFSELVTEGKAQNPSPKYRDDTAERPHISKDFLFREEEAAKEEQNRQEADYFAETLGAFRKEKPGILNPEEDTDLEPDLTEPVKPIELYRPAEEPKQRPKKRSKFSALMEQKTKKKTH